jgi:hypothetical protein
VRLAFRWVALLTAFTAAACSASATAPCDLSVQPVLLGRLLHLDSAGTCIMSADSLYSRIEVLADTFRVCGLDTTRLSGIPRRFTSRIPMCG